MNIWLAHIADALGPIAFLLGVALIIQLWRLKNEAFMVVALMLITYQIKNLANSISVWQYGAGLVRPTGLLVISIVARVVEIAGGLIGVLYYSGKLSNLMSSLARTCFGEAQEIPPTLTTGEVPATTWEPILLRTSIDGSTQAIRRNIKPEYLVEVEVTTES